MPSFKDGIRSEHDGWGSKHFTDYLLDVNSGMVISLFTTHYLFTKKIPTNNIHLDI